MVTLSEKAIKQVKNLIQEQDSSKDLSLRIKIEKGGCSGQSYKLDFTDMVEDDDKLVDCGDVSVVIDKQSLLYVIGLQLDFDGGLNGQGFQFLNPNANKTCSCGSSFSV